MAPVTNTSAMEFEVFLSFRGPDTRDNFTSCLYSDMVEKGIRVFKDDEDLHVGQKISGDLLCALDGTQIYIPIFSKGFASSPWCLREIAHMVDCTSNSDGKKKILPVFFDVEPDDVKLKTNLYRDALSEHQKKYGSCEVKRWRDALVEVPTRLGWRLQGKGYGEVTKLIVQEVLHKLKGKNRLLPDHLVETNDLKRIEELLDIDANDLIRFVIIHGTGGIGKTTLASVIFNKYRSKFNFSSFLGDVRSYRILDVQKKLLSETLGSSTTQEIYNTDDGSDRIKRTLCNKKVLVVVDNVDEKKQLEGLAGSCDWFGSGSRIIITLRDIRIIQNKDNHARPSNYKDYSVQEMPFNLALQLFSKHAFRSNTPPKDCYEFSKEVVSSIGRLPLTLEVVGSLFSNTVKLKWDARLEELKKAPHEDVRQTLMISINKLDKIGKSIFLDIACFCIGENKTYAEYMWRGSNYCPSGAIDVLLLMSLIKIDEKDNTFWMHDEVRDLGRYIDKEENFEDAGACRLLQIDENTLHVLLNNEEKRAVRALNLGIGHDLTPGELARLPMWRFLSGKMNFLGDFKNLLYNLRWLVWHHCPENFSPMNFHPLNLAVLDLSGSNITHHWDGWKQIEVTKKLKVLDLSNCWQLTKTPDFSEFAKLEKLILYDCENLVTIDSSIGNLKLLNTLNMKGCESLQGLPEEIGSLECLSEIIWPYSKNLIKLLETLGNLKSLTKIEIYGDIDQVPHSIGRLNLTDLVLSSCTDLQKLPESIGDLELLLKLDLNHSGIFVLPYSIGKLKNLQHLCLSSCNNLHELPESIGVIESLLKLDLNLSKIFVLPDSIGKLRNLQHLCLSSCNNLRELPESIGDLESLLELDLNYLGISVIPDSIGKLRNLQHLCLSSCNNLRELPESIGDLESLLKLDLNDSGISVLPNSIGKLRNLQHMCLSSCNNLCELPESIGDLESLLELDLNGSKICILPHSIGKLKNITHLYFLENGDLALLERFVGEPISLVQLKLTFRRISILLDSIERLTSFTHLSFSECQSLHELPNSIGQMKLLIKLDLKSSDISVLPDSIGNLKRLEVLNVAHTKICTIPSALGGVEMLKELDASFCPNLMDEIPWEMWSLPRLRILDLDGSPISTVPRKISGFSSLQTLKIASHRLSPLPELPSSLECLMVGAAQFPILPDLSSLVHLRHLEVRKEQGIPFWLLNGVTPPRKDGQSVDRLPLSLSTLKLHSIPQLPDFFDFHSLLILSISWCLTPHLRGLSRLKKLQELRLSDLPQLAEISGLGELESLKFLHILMCDVIRQLPNLSKLKDLRRLELKRCSKLRAIEGLKELENLENVEIMHCMSLERFPDVSASTKLETNWTPPKPAEHSIQPAKRLQLSLGLSLDLNKRRVTRDSPEIIEFSEHTIQPVKRLRLLLDLNERCELQTLLKL